MTLNFDKTPHRITKTNKIEYINSGVRKLFNLETVYAKRFEAAKLQTD